MNFKDTLTLWMAGYGIGPEDCEKVCAHPGVAMSIKLQDSGGMLTDLLDGLHTLPFTVYQDAVTALRNPGEKLLLMGILDNARSSRSASASAIAIAAVPATASLLSVLATPEATPSTSPPAAPRVVNKTELLRRICQQMTLTAGEYRTLSAALA